MKGWILNLCYLMLLVAAFPVLLWKRVRYGKYRDGWSHKLLGKLPHNNGEAPLIWLHAVSVGEVLLLRPIVKRLKEVRPDCQLLITSTTSTGYQLIADKFPGCQRAWFPLDFTWSVRNAITRVRPDLVVLAELEVWPNFLLELNLRQIPVILINGRLGQKSFQGYRRLKFLFQPLLSSIRIIAAQTGEYVGRFLALGVPEDQIHMTGSVKFDGLQTNRRNPGTNALRNLFQLPESGQVWVAGSTQSPEEAIVMNVFRMLKADLPDLRLILVPRHPERIAEVSQIIQEAGFTFWKRSQAAEGTSRPRPEDVLVIDTVGELGACWGLADVAFVGGSLGNRGGQNMIEPAAYGAVVCFGPRTWNFRQVVEMLLTKSAATVVQNDEDLYRFVLKMFTCPELAAELGDRARELVLAQAGATERTLELLLPLLPPLKASSRRAA